MKVKSVELEISAVRRSQYPINDLPEFLLIGRSNVGKSSFINTIINRKNYARTSGRPGKTQTINFYNINTEFYLVDAPGYGYAGVSREKRKKFGLMIEDYLVNRSNLKQVFLLIDFRHRPTNDDLLMYNFLKYYKIPVTIVATKCDKIGKTLQNKQKKSIISDLHLNPNDDFIMFSNINKTGKEEIINKIENLSK
ncbi:MAG: YihA family ribosome biogenesis GTP-binding protein [Bacilli bacterium]|nr:YihA family ribosome biogenesis GTP-binding protein [Bacilli bacterium]